MKHRHTHRCGTSPQEVARGSAACSAAHLADSILSESLPAHCEDSSKKYNALFSLCSSWRLRRTVWQTLMSWLLPSRLNGFDSASMLVQYTSYCKSLMFISCVVEFVHASLILCDLGEFECFTVNYIKNWERSFGKTSSICVHFLWFDDFKRFGFFLQILYVTCEGKRQNVWYVWNGVRITEFFNVVRMQWNMCTVSWKPMWVGHLLFSDFRRILWGEKLIVENFLLKFAEKSKEWLADESTKLRKCPFNFKWNIECSCMIKDKDTNWLQTLELKS